MKEAINKRDSLFSWLYYGSSIAIIAVFAFSFLIGLNESDGDPNWGLLIMLLSAITFVVPFLILLVGVSIWGVVRYKQGRAKYIITLAIAVAWLAYIPYAHATLVLP